MFKKVVKESIQTLLQKPKIVRLAFLTTFGHTIRRIYLVAYFINSILTQKYQSGINLGDALMYVLTKIQEFEITGYIIALIIIVAIGNFLIYPIGEAALIYHVQDEGKKIGPSIIKGMKKFFVMLEFNGLGFSFGLYTFGTILIRTRVMGVLNNVIVEILLGIWGLMVIFALLFRPYTKYLIVIENKGVFDAIKRSILMTLSNRTKTLQFISLEFILFFRFIINVAIVIGIPLLLLYGAISFNIIDNAFVETLLWVITIILLFFVAYINGIIEAFFTTYRNKAYNIAKQNIIE